MQGQWFGDIEGEYKGTLRVELEERENRVVGNAYLFYEERHTLPGFVFYINVSKTPPHVTEVSTVYLYANGGRMTQEARDRIETELIERFGRLPIPPKLNVELKIDGSNLSVEWAAEGAENLELKPSSVEGPSKLIGRTDLTTWDQFRQWAIIQSPRNFMFRGQSKPRKLATTFHRTWRKDLNAWIVDDVRMLFGTLIERVSYPLQLGNMEHNAAFWSILQHHGYPTPLLDWTLSPFVAAYFAFQNVKHDDIESPRIFILNQASWNEKYGKLGFIVDAAPPQVIAMESIPVGNPRAAPQQALSTVSNVADIEEFIRKKEQEDGKSYLTVCDLSPTEAPKIMRELELMGITYGSLFPGLDGMCRDMRDRLFGRQV